MKAIPSRSAAIPWPFRMALPGTSASAAAVGSAAPGQVKIGELYGALAQPTTSRPTQAELDAADTATTNWLMYNKGYRGERYSLLKQINTQNAGKLRPVCMFQLGELGTFEASRVCNTGASNGQISWLWSVLRERT